MDTSKYTLKILLEVKSVILRFFISGMEEVKKDLEFWNLISKLLEMIGKWNSYMN